MIDGFIDSKEIEKRQSQERIKRAIANKQRDSYLFFRLCFAIGMTLIIVLSIACIISPISFIQNDYILLGLFICSILMTGISLYQGIKYETNKEK